jgi:hypothetical protein
MSSTQYDPVSESTPALAKQARETGRLMLDVSGAACLCGCREPTPGRFRPGHDARLKGKLTRAAIAKVKVGIVRDGSEKEMTARAFAKEVSTEAYDWTPALDRAVEAAKAKTVRVAQVKQESKAQAQKEVAAQVPDPVSA